MDGTQLWLLTGLAGSALVVAAALILTRRQRAHDREFRARHPGYEGFHASVPPDRADALRALRDTAGEGAAVREVRREHPGVRPADAVRLVREL